MNKYLDNEESVYELIGKHGKLINFNSKKS